MKERNKNDEHLPLSPVCVFSNFSTAGTEFTTNELFGVTLARRTFENILEYVLFERLENNDNNIRSLSLFQEKDTMQVTMSFLDSTCKNVAHGEISHVHHGLLFE